MRLLLCAQLMLLALTAYATGQEGDVIYINGERLELLGKPICLDSTLYHTLKDELPSNRPIVTSNWDGFTAYWSINNDRLYLDSVRCEAYDAPKNYRRMIAVLPDHLFYVLFDLLLPLLSSQMLPAGDLREHQEPHTVAGLNEVVALRIMGSPYSV